MSVEQCCWLPFPRIEDERGNLTFIEAERHVPFAIRRVYYLYEIPPGAARGGHAHKQLEQVLIAASGSFDVVLDDGRTRRRVTLDRADRGLYVPRMIWRELEHFTANSVCLVMASAYYAAEDYFRDYDEFVEQARSS
ncbi:MAG TPA: FdtA/QdtA family cupin domain-containing protein [Gemmatimonadales bacterium]|nr:FdtA/QdtA family cupin domain-containing protein [Gemmatimonadales bacterium]